MKRKRIVLRIGEYSIPMASAVGGLAVGITAALAVKPLVVLTVWLARLMGKL